MLTFSLANLLIFNADSLTPWTNIILVVVTDYEYSYYQNNTKYGYAISATKSITQFADVMNHMTFNFTFDYTVAIMKYEIVVVFSIINSIFFKFNIVSIPVTTNHFSLLLQDTQLLVIFN